MSAAIQSRQPAPGFITLTLHEGGFQRWFSVAHIVGFQPHGSATGTIVDDARTMNAIYDMDGIAVRESCEEISALITAARDGVA